MPSGQVPALMSGPFFVLTPDLPPPLRPSSCGWTGDLWVLFTCTQEEHGEGAAAAEAPGRSHAGVPPTTKNDIHRPALPVVAEKQLLPG